MEEEVKFLLKHIPLNVHDRAVSCIDKFVNSSDDIIYKQRFISLFSFRKSALLPSFFPKQDEIINYISQPIKYSEFINGSQVLLISKFYEYIWENPNELIPISRNAFQNLDKYELNFFIRSTIPSLFGYFATGDHDVTVYSYYSSIVINLKPKYFKQILPPYFTSSNTTPFIRKIYDNVSFFICNDIRFLNSDVDDKNVESHAKLLAKSIVSNLILLPSTHLNIISLMQQSGLSEVEVYDFLIRNVVLPQLEIYLSTSPFSGIIKIFRFIALKSISLFESCIEPCSLYKTKSIFEIPLAYKNLGRRYLRFIATIKDIEILYKISKKSINIPPLLHKLKNLDQLRHLGYQPILFNIYPKDVITNEIKLKSKMIFGDLKKAELPKIPGYDRIFVELNQRANRERKFVLNYFDTSGKADFYEKMAKIAMKNCESEICQSETSNEDEFSASSGSFSLTEFKCETLQRIENDKISFRDFVIMKQYNQVVDLTENFETFMEILFLEKQIEKWHEIVQATFEQYILSAATEILTSYNFENEKTFSLQRICQLYNQKSVICSYFSWKAESILKEWQNEETDKLVSKFSDAWMRTVKSLKIKQIETEKFSKSRRLIFGHYFHRISVIFENIEFVRFSKRYIQIINGSMESVNLSRSFFNSDIDVLVYALEICSNPCIAVTSVLICASLIGDSVFIQNLDPEKYKSLILMQKAIRYICMKDEELFSLYKELHFSISEFFESRLF